MDKFHQNILKILRKNIVVDIDVHNGIIKPLQSEYILTEQHITEIETGTTKQQKAEILLDILPSRGPYAFDIFRQALRHHYEWLSQDMDKLEENRKSFNDIKYMGTPTLPPISPLTVVREQKTKQLQYYLEQLQPNGYVVLHGMKGFGKSCLTASTLKDTKFNEVYWIKFGYKRSADEEILIQLNRLYHLVKNLEILPESLKPELLKDSLIHFLKYHFSRENHCQALLILDDVCDSKIIEVFDFECKTLVITADLDLVLDKRPSVISVNYTLQILWEGCPFQVEEMMLDLCHKSLAAKQWNDELRSYIYGVHDLLLCHLRKKFSKNELIKMHQSLIEKYRKYCNDDFSKLPADNYIYSYIGYHLQQAHLYEEFPKIYLDFDFIQATVVNSGLNNLLFDLNNYRKYITKNNDPIYEVRFTDLEKFLEEQASIIVEHRRKKCLDIVQIAMNYSYDGYVKETAIKLARERSKHLYIFHNKKLGQMYVPCSEETSTEIYTTCFAYDRDLILIGNGSGEIFLWDSVYKGQKIFSGHDKNSKIKKIVISNEEDCFLSLDDHGIVKLFRLSDHENDEHNIAVLSPRQKQSSWSGIFTSTIPPDDSLITFSIADETILDMTFTHDNNHVAACTNRGTIRIWDHCGNILEDHSHNPQSYLKNIAFTMESNLLHIMDETNGVLISYCKYDKEYQYLSQYNPDLQKKNIIFFRSVPNQNNSLFIVTEEKAVYIKWFRSSNNHMHSYNKQIRANVEDKKSVYVCASLTNDGQYIVLADSSGFINIWKVDVGQQPIATYKSRVCSLDTFWLKKEGYHVICGSENQLLHKWKLPVQGTYTSIRKPVFDALVQGFGGAPDTVVTETLSNTIIALRGDKVIAESKPIDGKISHLILSDEREIIYVTDKGIVNFCDIALKNNKCILTFQSNVELVKILNILDTSVHKVIICRATDNVWVNINRTYSIEDTGYVISIYEIDTKYILTVTRDGIIRIWYASGSNWLRRRKVTVGSPDIVTIFSCLSYEKRFLTVLNENGDVILYYLQYDTRTVPVSINITEHFRKKYSCKLTCCEISQNEKYLAVGFESGEISVIDISMQEEIRKLCFHTSSITQLHWAPSTVEIPILLSVSSGELVWWNITLAIYLSKPKRIRHIMNRSFSTPSVDGKVYVNSHISASQSVDSHMCDMQHQLEDNTLTNDVPNLSKFWRSKESKDPRHSALLAVVELPSNYFTKVCISADFTKFVTVDIYGSISTFTLCEYN
ncbi:Apoptotic protease-activating factor 1 [Habropoda laboriosa]|uniref:Apoptotic protease-activating factor 1 n=1 Tax=Habropoda laboriosa TaxID=597456 RepID=A0A0L7QS16_9HYME|nr:Apoptotic protease-activating factor 1 [Habropoda laboriosa]